jgi:hypothetical protein
LQPYPAHTILLLERIFMTWSVYSGKTLHVESGVIEKPLEPVEERPCQTDAIATRTVILQVGKQSERTVRPLLHSPLSKDANRTQQHSNHKTNH